MLEGPRCLRSKICHLSESKWCWRAAPSMLTEKSWHFSERSNLGHPLNLGRSRLFKGGACDPWRGKERVRSHRLCCKLGPHARSLDFVFPVLPKAGSYQNFTKTTLLLDLILQTLELNPFIYSEFPSLWVTVFFVGDSAYDYGSDLAIWKKILTTNFYQ